jgi:hypothetical protein
MKRSRGAVTVAGVVALLALFAALCVIFVGVVSFAEWRDEVAMQQWVPAMAVVERGELTDTSSESRSRPVHFRLRYRVGFEVNGQRQIASVASHSTADQEVIGAMGEWSEQHKPGSQVAIRYDPAQPTNAVFDPQTPGAGSRMESNLMLLAITLGACCVLFPLARFLGARERALRLGR